MAVALDSPSNAVTTRLRQAVNWGRKYSLWPMPFGTACCAIEFMSTVSSYNDISRFGAEAVRFSPRQSDLLLVAGTISYKQVPILKTIYAQMCEPKWVIAMACAPPAAASTTTTPRCRGIDQVIPVDFYVAGCRRRPRIS